MPKGILNTHPLNIESNSFHSTLLRTVETVILLKKEYLIENIVTNKMSGLLLYLHTSQNNACHYL